MIDGIGAGGRNVTQRRRDTEKREQEELIRFRHVVHHLLLLIQADTTFPLCRNSTICTGDAASRSVLSTFPLLRSTSPKLSTPVGHDCTHALHRTHSGSCIGIPLFAKFITSMP